LNIKRIATATITVKTLTHAIKAKNCLFGSISLQRFIPLSKYDVYKIRLQQKPENAASAKPKRHDSNA
jgi:hypothetical protein